MDLLNIEVVDSAQNAEIVVFRLKGHLDAQTVRELEGSFTLQLQAARVRWIVDLGGLDYISSAGLGSFIGVLAELQAKGGNIFFIGMTPKIEKIFKMLGFMRIFKIFASEAEAVRAFKGA
ncbi:MAG TPA: STAS domain-containing protein [bacterium]|jgi:anti-sigma B factor antagonist|nr:STAS domain-containing protein [bacterium]